MNNLISTCLLVKNEEKNIEDCLKSVLKISDEIIVVDNASTDRTVAICKQYHCQIIEREEGTESELRNEYIRLAKNPWIFVIDADERLDQSCESLFSCLVNSEADIYRFPVNNYYGHGKWCTFIPVVIHHLDSLIKERSSGKREKYMKNLMNQISNPQYENQKMRLINNLGVEYAALFQYSKSKECFMMVIEDGGFYKDLAALYYAQVCVKNKEFNIAEEMLHHLIYKTYSKDQQPINIGVDTVKTLTEDLFQRCCVVLSEIAFQQKKYDEALYWCDEAIQYWPFASQHYLNRAFILKTIGDGNWEKDYKKAYELNSYLDKPIIYKEGNEINIYEFQTSLLVETSSILSLRDVE